MYQKSIAAVLLAVVFVGAAHAQEAVYSARFEVLQSIPNGPAPDSPVRSTDDHASQATISARDQTGSVFDPGSGSYVPQWGPTVSVTDFEFARIPQLDRSTWGTAEVLYPFYGISAATGHVKDSGGQLQATSSWWRGFELDAHSSFTFSGIATLNISGDAQPLSLASSHFIDAGLGFAALSVYDAAERVRTSMGVTISNALGGLGDLFTYRIGPDGLLSITVNNTTGRMLTGYVRAANSVDASVVAQVPEPRTYLLMALGLAALALAVPRRAAVQSGDGAGRG